MKNKLFGILIFPFIMISCSPDENTEDLRSVGINKKANFQKTGIILLGPENTLNPYDSIGRLHNEILEIYMDTNSGSNLTEDIMAQIQSIAFSSRINIVQDCDSPFAYNIIDTIVADPQTSSVNIIENSVLTTQGKANLLAFIDSVEAIKDQPYADIYEFIISYESGVLSSSILNNQDKRIILTTSSIVRYSTYYGKDRDWDGSVGNFTGAIVGTLNSSLSPVTMALVTGLKCNNTNGD